MDYLKKSIKVFSNTLNKNPDITKEEWDKYADENRLYGSLTLETHLLTEDEFESGKNKFELLKDKLMPINLIIKRWWH